MFDFSNCDSAEVLHAPVASVMLTGQNRAQAKTSSRS